MPTAEPLDLNLPRSRLGEGIFWDETSGRVFWVDIAGRQIHSCDLQGGDHRSTNTRLPVSFVFPMNAETVLAGLADEIVLLDRSTGKERSVATLSLPEGHRLNDGKCDSDGRLWAGTINTSDEPSETAALYRLDHNGLSEVEGGYTNANGKTWSPDGAILYHADTSRGIIWQYDYDPATGVADHKRVFVNLGEARPDGLASDADGNIYAAIFGGSCVSVLSPRGEKIEQIDVPAPHVTSCAFGGEGLRTLLITTAYDGMDDAALKEAPLSGHVFAIERAIPGLKTSIPSAQHLPHLQDRT
jgi:sugar lactone lactonase YvrE